MKSGVLAFLLVPLALPTFVHGDGPTATIGQSVRNYSKEFQAIDRSIPLLHNQRAADKIAALRKAIGEILLENRNGELQFSSRRHALQYVLESTTENAFYPGYFRDYSVDLLTDYRRYSTFLGSLPYLKVFQSVGSQLVRPTYNSFINDADPTPRIGSVQFYRQFCPARGPQLVHSIDRTCSQFPSAPSKCKAALEAFCQFDDSTVLSTPLEQYVFAPNRHAGSCMSESSNSSLLNIKIGFVLEALIKRGRIIPVDTTKRKALAKTHPRGKSWLELAESSVSSGARMSTRLSPQLPDYDLLGLYDCTKDGSGFSGKIYIDATLNPYDLATFVLHELNHFAADKLWKTYPGLSPNEVSYLEDVGSFTLSALSQIEQTVRHFGDRWYARSRFRSQLDSMAPNLGGPLLVFYQNTPSFHDYGDLTRFSIGKEGAGALNAYLAGESRANEFTRTSSQLRKYEPSATPTPICEGLQLLKEGWINQLGQPYVSSSRLGSTPPSQLYPNIYHQIAGGCYNNLNVSKLSKDTLFSENAMQFNYTPILDLLKSWDGELQRFPELTEVGRLEQLRKTIDFQVGTLLKSVSPSCSINSGTDGGKSGGDGGKAGHKDRAGVDGGKAGRKERAGVDGGKAGVEGGKP